ncbi:tyrosinase cofactor [Streptomyces sp. NPDC006798]|uniref:apotyrosinase chaperone MelC1 n=1 Tax=Streptomyces sp. NPDC006798 TaxID=3155462 RepID=UPI0033CCD7D2
MSRFTRRQVIGAAAGAAAGTALIGVATATAVGSSGGHTTHGPAKGLDSFDEVFQGRRIQGLPAEGHAAKSHAAHGGYQVLIDGRELHIMKHDKYGWSSAVNHYSRFKTPLDAARGAVESLKGAQLVPFMPTV